MSDSKTGAVTPWFMNLDPDELYVTYQTYPFRNDPEEVHFARHRNPIHPSYAEYVAEQTSRFGHYVNPLEIDRIMWIEDNGGQPRRGRPPKARTTAPAERKATCMMPQPPVPQIATPTPLPAADIPSAEAPAPRTVAFIAHAKPGGLPPVIRAQLDALLAERGA